MKQAIDFPQNVWLEAAGECENCQAIPQAMVTYVDKKNNALDVTFRIKHATTCYNNEEGDELTDIGTWITSKNKLTVSSMKGRFQFDGFSASGNVTPCSACEKLLWGVPLMLFSLDHKTEYRFCWPCSNNFGILKLMANKNG